MDDASSQRTHCLLISPFSGRSAVGSSLLRNVSRVVEDALLVVGEEGDSMHGSGSNTLALEVASDYAEATQWEGGGRGKGWVFQKATHAFNIKPVHILIEPEKACI